MSGPVAVYFWTLSGPDDSSGRSVFLRNGPRKTNVKESVEQLRLGVSVPETLTGQYEERLQNVLIWLLFKRTLLYLY